MKSFALSLNFIVRLTATRKWPIKKFKGEGWGGLHHQLKFSEG